SSWNCTPATPLSSVAVARTVTVPDKVVASIGAPIATTGGAVSVGPGPGGGGQVPQSPGQVLQLSRRPHVPSPQRPRCRASSVQSSPQPLDAASPLPQESVKSAPSNAAAPTCRPKRERRTVKRSISFSSCGARGEVQAANQTYSFADRR